MSSIQATTQLRALQPGKFYVAHGKVSDGEEETTTNTITATDASQIIIEESSSSSSSSSSVIIVAIRAIHSSLGQEPGQCLLVRNSRCRHPQPLEHLNQFGNTKGFVTCDHLLD
mmetsp:Transcript_30001/g.64699  ORF Transcript_30001/g.64699 Transcript_30001/m.64699 type:complete len:114 (-) Transcript_30001:734-1075(-)